MGIESIGYRIKKARQLNDLTQKQLASKINVSHQLISQWENGGIEPSISNLLLISQATGFSLFFFLEDIESNQSQVRLPFTGH